MSAAVAEASTPKFSGSEVLVARGNEGVVRSILSGEQQTRLARGINRADTLKKREGTIGRATLKENLARRGKESYDASNIPATDKFRDAFKSSGSTENAARGDALVKSTADYLKYDTIRKAMDADPSKFPKEVADKLGIKTEAEYKAIRTQALDFLLHNENVSDTFGDLLTNVGDKDKQRLLIEETLAKDPGLRTEMARKMEDIRKRAEALPPAIEEDKPLTDARDVIAVAKEHERYTKAQVQQLILSVVGKDKAGNLLITGPELAGILGKIDHNLQFDGAVSSDATLTAVKGQIEAVLALRDPNYKLHYDRNRSLAKISQLEEDIKEAKGELGTVRRLASAVVETKDVKALEAQIATEKAIAETNKKALRALPEDEQDALEYKINMIDGIGRNTKTGDRFDSPLANHLDVLLRNKQAASEASKYIHTREHSMTSAEKAQRAVRERAESALLDELENVVSESVEKVILERAAALGEIEIDETNQENAKRFKKIEERMKQWSTLDNKKRKVVRDRAEIGTDIREVARFGNEGIQRLILRDMFQNLDVLKDSQGNDVRLPDGRIASWDTIGLDALPSDIKPLLDEAMTKYGEKYTQKLFTDYFAARGIKDRSFKGPMGFEMTTGIALKEYEWTNLAETYADKLTVALDKSNPRTSEAYKKLIEQGIAPDSKKGKVLLAVLLGILAPAAIGVGVAAALPGAATLGVMGVGGAIGGAVMPTAAGLGALTSNADIA